MNFTALQLMTGVAGQGTPGVTWRYTDATQRVSNPIWGFVSNAFQLPAIVWTGTQFVVGGESGKIATSTDGITWVFRSGLQSTGWLSTSTVESLSWNGTELYAVGLSGMAASSADGGITWTRNTQFTTEIASNSAFAIVWTGTRYVAGGIGGRILTSSDGVTWTATTGLSSTAWGTSANVLRMVWTGTAVIAIGSSGRCATSPDGLTWTYRSTLSATSWGTSGTGRGIAWNGSYVIAVGDANRGARSDDHGATWSFQSIASTNWSLGGLGARCIAWSGSRWYVGGTAGEFTTSTDGINWTANTTNLKNNADWGQIAVMGSVAWGNNKFVGCGDPGSRATSATSTDGLSWTVHTNGLNGFGTAFGNGNVLGFAASPTRVVAAAGTSVCTSDNSGTTWTYRDGLRPNSIFVSRRMVEWSGTQFVVGSGSNRFIGTSPDGITWTLRNGIPSTAWGTSDIMQSMATTGSTIVVGGDAAKIAYSTDGGATWTYSTGLQTAWNTTNVFDRVWGLATDGTTWVATGRDGRAATSTNNGATWTDRTTAFQASGWSSLVATNVCRRLGSLFVVGGNGSRICTSSDGVTWTQQLGLQTAWNSTTTAVTDITLNSKGVYVAVGASSPGRCATSTNLINWVNQPILSTVSNPYTTPIGTRDILCARAVGIRFLVASEGGICVLSP